MIFNTWIYSAVAKKKFWIVCKSYPEVTETFAQYLRMLLSLYISLIGELHNVNWRHIQIFVLYYSIIVLAHPFPWTNLAIRCSQNKRRGIPFTFIGKFEDPPPPPLLIWTPPFVNFPKLSKIMSKFFCHTVIFVYIIVRLLNFLYYFFIQNTAMHCNSFFELNSNRDPPPQFIRTPRLLNRGSSRDPPFITTPPPACLFGSSE